MLDDFFLLLLPCRFWMLAITAIPTLLMERVNSLMEVTLYHFLRCANYGILFLPEPLFPSTFKFCRGRYLFLFYITCLKYSRFHFTLICFSMESEIVQLYEYAVQENRVNITPQNGPKF